MLEEKRSHSPFSILFHLYGNEFSILTQLEARLAAQIAASTQQQRDDQTVYQKSAREASEKNASEVASVKLCHPVADIPQYI